MEYHSMAFSGMDSFPFIFLIHAANLLNIAREGNMYFTELILNKRVKLKGSLILRLSSLVVNLVFLKIHKIPKSSKPI